MKSIWKNGNIIGWESKTNDDVQTDMADIWEMIETTLKTVQDLMEKVDYLVSRNEL